MLIPAQMQRGGSGHPTPPGNGLTVRKPASVRFLGCFITPPCAASQRYLKKCLCFPLRSPRRRGDVLLIGGAAAIRADTQPRRVLSPEFWLSMTERISEPPRCQMGDRSFMGIVCGAPRNTSALSALKHTERFRAAEAAASPHLCRRKLYLRPAASSARSRNNHADLRRRPPLPNPRYVNV